MSHSVVVHVDHADHIDHEHEHGVKKLTHHFVEALKAHGHDVEHAHVHWHDHSGGHHKIA